MKYFLMPREMTRGTGHKFIHRKLNIIIIIKKYCEGGPTLEQVVKEVGKCPPLEILETRQNPRQPSLSDCALSRDLDWTICRAPSNLNHYVIPFKVLFVGNSGPSFFLSWYLMLSF